ncbi:adenylyl-sulfate kinase [Streptomyces violens]|uniref:adenylyl-sulfate kinase n=1 Tax=Streptomyces violens TaxID=66377 RepID=UPI0004BF1FE1|nr:adenylyl-sulfate kinase [Streptomyces violens]
MVVHPGPCDCGVTVLLTGLPSAGKSTLAHLVAEPLRHDGYRVEVLDGDEMRKTLTADLGYSREDRHQNLGRIGLMAEVLARNGVLVLVPVVAPYADSRDAIRQRHSESGTAFLEVHVATPVEVCAQRDVKGLYAKQRAGELTGLTGVDDPYEIPEKPDLVIPAHGQPAAESAAALRDLLVERRFVA